MDGSEQIRFQAGGNRRMDIQFTPDGKCMLVRGLIVDTLDDIGTVFDGDLARSDIDQKMEMWQKYDSEARAWLKTVWQDGNSLSQVARKHPTIHDIRRAYARALIGVTSEEYNSPEHQDYLSGTWSSVNMHRQFERWGILRPIPKKTREYMERIAG